MYKHAGKVQRKLWEARESCRSCIFIAEQSGQATVEYAVALAAFLALLLGLGALAKTLMAGTFVHGAAEASPGTAAISVLAAAQDILLF